MPPSDHTLSSSPVAPAVSVSSNRFFGVEGDVSLQLAPWELRRLNFPISTARFVLQHELRFRSDIARGVIVVEKGYRSDLASIPQFAWSIFMAPDDPRIELGGWVHDWLYEKNGVIVVEDVGPTKLSRKQADQILAHEAMPELGATPAQCATVYQALRRFGRAWPGDSFWERLS